MPLSPQKSSPVTGNASSRVARHRAAHCRLEVSVSPQVGATIDDLALLFECNRSVVVRSLLRYALTSRDWKRLGLLWRE